MSEVLTALLDPQVVVAFLTFVVGPAVGVLIAAKREAATDATTKPAPPADKTSTDRRIRRDDRVVAEAFTAWAAEQQEEIDRLRAEVETLRTEVSDLRRERALDQQHIRVLQQQLAGLGVAPLGGRTDNR